MVIEWTKAASRDMRRIGDPTTHRRIVAAIVRYAESRHGDIKALQGIPGEYRLRVGDWRVRFALDGRGHIQVLVVLRVLPRGSAY